MANSSFFQTSGTSSTTETNIQTEVDAAEAAKIAAQAAQAAAETAETNAETAEANSETAQAASEAARDLSLSYRDTAETHKDAAATSAAAALVSQNAAASSATSTAADVVSTNADVVSTNADAAATASDRTAAALSASSASTSAATATTKASESSTSAAAALASQNAAASSAAAALVSQNAAASSATSTAADVVSTNADVVSTNADAASTASDRSAAASSASAAATSASNAASSATSAANSLSSFNAVYSTGTSDPTTNLATGDLFYNETSGVLKVYTGTAWEQGVTAGSGFLPLTGGGLTGNLTTSGLIDGRDVAADGTKLDGIESGATADQTASEILTAVKTVDGASSGLDADLLDGQHGSYYTSYTDTAVANLVDSAPGTLDTLNELAAALGDDANFSTTVTNSIATKLPLAGGTMTGKLTVSSSTGEGILVSNTSASGNSQIKLDGATDFQIGTGQASSGFANKLFFYDATNTATRMTIDSSGIDVTGTVTFDGGTTSADLNFGDNDKAQFGASNDLQIYHNGSHSRIEDAGTGKLQLGSNTEVEILKSGFAESIAKFIPDGAVELYYDNSKKLATAATGIDVTGNITVSGNVDGRDVASDGSKLDGIEASADVTDTTNVVAALTAGTNVSIAADGTISSTDTNTTYTADGNYGLTLSGTTFRLENDRRRASTTTDVYSGNTHDYTFYDQDVGIRWYTAGAEEMRLENDGDLHVDGNITAYSTTVSDPRLKTDIEPVTDALSKLEQLNGYTFTYKHDGSHSAGVVSTEVAAVLPSAIRKSKVPLVAGHDNETLYDIVQYDQLHALLIEAVKELSARVKELENDTSN